MKSNITIYLFIFSWYQTDVWHQYQIVKAIIQNKRSYESKKDSLGHGRFIAESYWGFYMVPFTAHLQTSPLE